MGEKKRRMASAASGPAAGKQARKPRFSGMRITWKAVGLFMLLMVLLDVMFYAVFKFGFDSCYAMLCLLE